MARTDFEQHNTYDPDEVWAKGAADEQGHSVNLRIKVPTEWAGAIAELTSAKQWPEYKTPQDFIRDAIHHRLHWAEAQPDRESIPEVANLMAIESVYTNIRRYEALNKQFKAMRDQMVDAFRDSAVTDPQVLAAQIEDLSDVADRFPEPFRTRLHEDLDYWKRRV